MFLLFHSYLFIHICASESQSHVTHTLAFEKKLSCHLSILEGQFHIIHSFGKHACAILAWVHFFFKSLLCYNIHISKCIIYYLFTLQGIFMPHIHIFRNIFLCHVHLHIYLHTIEEHLPCYLGAKCQSWGSPNFYKQVPIFMLF